MSRRAPRASRIGRWLVAASAGVTVVSGGSPLIISPFVMGLALVCAVVLLYLGRHVRRYAKRKKTWMTALMAMRVAIGARTSALVSALLCGMSVGLLLVCVGRMDASGMAMAVWSAAIFCLASLLWLIVGVVVERWCVVDTDDDDSHPRGSGRSSTARSTV